MKTILFMLLTSFYARTVTTELANDLERRLQANRDTYLQGPHTQERHRLALQYFDSQWARFRSGDGCGSALLGSAGRNCLEERSRNGKWPWEAYYRDAIVQAQPTEP